MPFFFHLRSSTAGDVSRAIYRRTSYPCRQFASSNVAGTDLASKSLAGVQSGAQSETVLCVNYLPEGGTEGGVAKVFAPHAKVRNVHIDTSRVGQFLGRAYVSFDSPEDFQRASSLQTPLQYRGETLVIEPWTLPSMSTSLLRVRNLPPRPIEKQELLEVFTPPGAVQDVWYYPGVRWCHVKFASKSAALAALSAAYERSFTIDGHKLDVQIGLDPPSRVLHLMGITGGEQQLQELLKDYKEHVQGACLGQYGSSVGLVEFDTVDSAVRARHSLEQWGIRVKFSVHDQLTPNVQFPPPDTADNPIMPNVVHVSNIPPSEKASSISRRFRLQSGAPFVIRVNDVGGAFTGRALMIYRTSGEATYVQRQHGIRPYTFRGVPLILTRCQAPRVSRQMSPTSTIVLHGAPTDFTLQNDVWAMIQKFGQIKKILRTGPTSYTIKFGDVDSAVRVIEAHCLKPYRVGKRSIRLFLTHKTGEGEVKDDRLDEAKSLRE